MSDRKTTEQTERTERLRRELHAQINSFKVNINFKEFRKTPHERAMLKLAKAEHKLSISK